MELTETPCPRPDRAPDGMTCYVNEDGHLLTVWKEDAEVEQEKITQMTGGRLNLRYSWHLSIGAYPRQPTDAEIEAVLEAAGLSGRAYFEGAGVVNRFVRHVFVR